MTIGKKLLYGYGVIVAMLIVVMAVGVYALTRTQASYETLVDANAEIVERTNVLSRMVRDQSAHFRGFLLYPDERAGFREQLTESRARADDTVEQMRMALGQLHAAKIGFEMRRGRGHHRNVQPAGPDAGE